MNTNLSPNSELHQSIVRVPDVAQVPDIWLDQARQFQQVMMHYTCAIREVKTKLEVLNDELSVKNQRNHIEMIKSRVKKPWREYGLSALLWMIFTKWQRCWCARMM